MLKVDVVRFAVGLARFCYFRLTRGRIRTLGASGGIAENTVWHNLKGMRSLASRRSTTLVSPLSVIEQLTATSSVLSIGPRTEGELLNLVAHGFDPKCIRGVDLISYSPWVDLGDMHSLPYEDNRWDATMMGWVIAYSDDKQAAAREVIRVTRPGGVVAVGVEYCPLDNEGIERELGYLAGSAERLTSTAKILELFEPHVGHVFFRHDPLPENMDRIGAICAIFSVAK